MVAFEEYRLNLLAILDEPVDCFARAKATVDIVAEEYAHGPSYRPARDVIFDLRQQKVQEIQAPGDAPNYVDPEIDWQAGGPPHPPKPIRTRKPRQHHRIHYRRTSNMQWYPRTHQTSRKRASRPFTDIATRQQRRFEPVSRNARHFNRLKQAW